MKRILLILLVVCAGSLSAETFTFKVLGIDCDGCAPPIVKALETVPGVSNPRVDAKNQTATVELAPNADKARIRAALDNAGFAAVFPGEKKTEFEKVSPEVARRLDIVSYPGKTRIDIQKILVPGKVTIVDFYGEWCGPCHVLEARLQNLMAGSKPNLALRRVDIGKWDNAAARQATRDFKAAALPYVRIYDARGQFVEAVTGGMWDEVLAAIEKAEARR